MSTPFGVGVWDQNLRFAEEGDVRESAAELEELGYDALWIPDVGGDVFGALRLLLSATSVVTVGTGVLNLWMHPAAETTAGYQEVVEDTARRPVLGIGVSHAPLVDAVQPGLYARPLAAVAQYLDELDSAGPPLPPEARLLAALRPRMLEIARERCGGAFPYHMPPEHTERARSILGSGARLVVEQCVVLDTDPGSARDRAREHLAMYLALPNYVNAWRWLGFTEADVSNGGSDRLLDAVVVCGTEDTIRERVQAQRDAGADHVCIQALAGDPKTLREAWRSLAPALRFSN